MEKSRRTLLVLVALLALAVTQSHAQIEGSLSNYTGRNAEGYLKPLQDGFGAGLQSGSFHTGYVPKDGIHFRLEFKTMFVKFGDDDRTFMATTEEGFFPETTVRAPTVIGDTLAVLVNGDNNTVEYFPGGLDIGSLAMAAPQITVGSFMGTEGRFRYLAFETGDAEVGDVMLLGIGARHSISQYFPMAPVDAAASIFWQKFELGDNLIDATAFSFGVQASRKFMFLEPYLGLSYDSFSMSVDYTSEVIGETLSVDFESNKNMHLTAGLGLNVFVVNLHGEINVSSQTTYALGLSVGY